MGKIGFKMGKIRLNMGKIRLNMRQKVTFLDTVGQLEDSNGITEVVSVPRYGRVIGEAIISNAGMFSIIKWSSHDSNCVKFLIYPPLHCTACFLPGRDSFSRPVRLYPAANGS